MSSPLARVPCTIVTGFLGSGKTTLIRHVLANANGRRLAVIVNEFGDVGIDGEILKGCGDAACPEENIVELANGCLCCTVADEFVPALDQILAREPQVEHIVIETSGLALPKPLVQAFHWPAIKSRVTVDGVVAVVDGAALADGQVSADLAALSRQRAADTALDHDDPIEEVFEDQIACADLVVLNKRDLLDAAGIDRAMAAIKARCRARCASSPWRTARSIPRRCSGSASAPRPISRTARRITTTSSTTTTTISTVSSWRCPRSPTPPRSPRASPRVAEAHNVLRMKGFAGGPGQEQCGCWSRRSARASATITTGPGGRPRRAQGNLVVIGLKGLDRDAVAKALLRARPCICSRPASAGSRRHGRAGRSRPDAGRHRGLVVRR